MHAYFRISLIEQNGTYFCLNMLRVALPIFIWHKSSTKLIATWCSASFNLAAVNSIPWIIVFTCRALLIYNFLSSAFFLSSCDHSSGMAFPPVLSFSHSPALLSLRMKHNIWTKQPPKRLVIGWRCPLIRQSCLHGCADKLVSGLCVCLARPPFNSASWWL